MVNKGKPHHSFVYACIIYARIHEIGTVLFTQTVSFLQKLVTAYQTGLPTHEILVSSFLLCTVDNRAPPSANTM